MQNVTANHRINDTIANEDGPQTLTGRFMYGPLDMVTLTGEKVLFHHGVKSVGDKDREAVLVDAPLVPDGVCYLCVLAGFPCSDL